MFNETLMADVPGHTRIGLNKAHFGPSGYALKNAYPGLSIGQSEAPVTGVGSGFFNGDELVRVGYEVPYEQWCFFLNFGNENCILNKFPDSTSKVLFSSMSSPDAASGFNLGINDYNKLYLEYNYDEHRKATPNTLQHHWGLDAMVVMR